MSARLVLITGARCTGKTLTARALEAQWRSQGKTARVVDDGRFARKQVEEALELFDYIIITSDLAVNRKFGEVWMHIICTKDLSAPAGGAK